MGRHLFVGTVEARVPVIASSTVDMEAVEISGLLHQWVRGELQPHVRLVILLEQKVSTVCTSTIA